MPTISNLSSKNVDESLQKLEDLLSRLDSDNLNLQWTQYVPTIEASGSMTYTAQTVTTARYLVVDKTCFVFIYAGGTIGGTPNGVLTCTLPIRPKAGYQPVFFAVVTDNSTDMSGFAKTSAPYSDKIRISKYNGGNFTAGAAEFFVSGQYEID